jgi:hypothetical protein
LRSVDLPGARVSGDRDHLAGLDPRGNAAQRLVAARITLGDRGELDHPKSASTNSAATKGRRSSVSRRCR